MINKFYMSRYMEEIEIYFVTNDINDILFILSYIGEINTCYYRRFS